MGDGLPDDYNALQPAVSKYLSFDYALQPATLLCEPSFQLSKWGPGFVPWKIFEIAYASTCALIRFKLQNSFLIMWVLWEERYCESGCQNKIENHKQFKSEHVCVWIR